MYGGLCNPNPAPHDSRRKYQRYFPQRGCTLDDSWIDAHSLWERKIVFYRKRGEIHTGLTFSELRLPGRLRIFRVGGSKHHPTIEYEDIGEHLPIYRVIPADGPDHIVYEKIGRHWSWVEPWMEAWEPGEPQFMRAIRNTGKPVFLLSAPIRTSGNGRY